LVSLSLAFLEGKNECYNYAFQVFVDSVDYRALIRAVDSNEIALIVALKIV